MKYKNNFGKRTILVGVLLTLIVVCGLSVAILRGVSRWFDAHTLQFNKPVRIELTKPIEVVDRDVESSEIIRIIETIPAPEDLKTDFDQYVYQLFGIEHYRMAIAVSRCEGYNHPEDGWNGNNNGSIDVGKFRINSVNFKIPGCSLKEVVDEEKNADCAYKIWDRGDGEEGNGKGNFNAWVGYTNGCALTKYE